MRIPKLLDSAKLSKNYSGLVDDFAKICEN